VNLQITFRDMPHSDAVEAHVSRRAAKLERLLTRIITCRVMVEAPHRHRTHGKRYHCRIDMMVPRDELVVGRNPADNLQHEDMHAAIDEAFDDAERLVVDYNTRLRERRKTARTA
jgi:ribosomal subunit interface protein